MKFARLGDHAVFLSGFAFNSQLFNDEGNGKPIIRIRDVVRGSSDTFYSGAYDDKYVVKYGDYLIGMDGEFNLAKWRSEPALLNQRVCKIANLSDDLDRDYLARYLTILLKKIEDETPFVTVKHLSVKKLNETIVPILPLPEQKRIATILDKADSMRTKRRETIKQLDKLAQSVFIEMFGDPVTNPKGWKVSSANHVAKRLTVGIVIKPASYYQEEGVPALRSLNVKPNKILTNSLVYVSANDNESRLKKTRVWQDDVILVRSGQPGTAAIAFRPDNNIVSF